MRLVHISTGSKLDFYRPDFSTDLELPLISVGISDGSPSPTEDFEEGTLDLTKTPVKNPASTFYARFNGTSMTDAGILDGDLLLIDKSLDPKNGDIAVCYLDDEFTVKRIALVDDSPYLIPAKEHE